MICDALKRECKYNINFDNNANNNYDFDIHKEIKCPHCKNVVYGAVGDKCPFCNRLYSMPEREHKKVDKIIIPLLIFCFPVGLILMWVNKSFYLKTRIILTIIFGIIFALAMCVGTSENKNVDESSSIDNAIVIEELI